MKRKASLKLSSAAKRPGRAGHSERKKGHHLEDFNGITKRDEYGRSGRPSSQDVPTPTSGAGRCLL